MKRLLKINKKLLLGIFIFLSIVSVIFALSRNPLKLDKNVYKAGEKVNAKIAMDMKGSKVSLLNPESQKIEAVIEQATTDGNSTITITPPRSFQPGKYTLEIIQPNGAKLSQNFMWGVLAINPNKSVYSSNENAYIAYAVLDENGKMVCDAQLELRITNNELGIDDTVSTKNGKIKVNPECSKKAKVEKDDFESNYKLKGEGTYKLQLSAKTKNGSYYIEDQVEVKSKAPFSVERTSRTRIYPVHKYDMLLTITANQDFNGVVSEYVPSEFVLSQFSNATNPFTESLDTKETGTKLLSWDLNIKKGEKVYLGYIYDAPDKSPWFFTTGPLKFKNARTEVFSENRMWQIAVDDVSPNGYWKFDEGVDNTCAGGTNDACNSGSDASTMDGALTGALWNTTGRKNKSLTFDATDDRVVVKSSANLAGQTTGSVSAWVYATTMDATQRGIYSEDIAGGTVLHLITVNSTFVFSIRSSAAVWTDCATTTTYSTNKWYHLAATFNSSNGDINLYVNGILACSSTTWDGTFTASVTSSLIGDYTNAGDYGFGGKIDEVKTYTSELTSSQVLADFNHGSSAVLGLANQSTLDNGLVGYWKMDETSGNASDSSGNSTTLTDGSTTTYGTGKFSNGADLEDSSTDYLYAADNSPLSVTGNLTITAWIKPESTTASTLFDIVGKWDGSNESYLLAQYGDEIRFYVDSSSDYVTTDSANLSTSTWYHVVATYNSTNQSVQIYINGSIKAATTTGTIPSSIGDDAGRFHIGAEDSTTSTANYYDGIVDDIRVYNKLFGVWDVVALYSFGPAPIGYWNFEEGTGVTTNDRSTTGNAGTLTNGPNWITGKYGNGLTFDGGDDYVGYGDVFDFNITEARTFMAWVNTNSIAAGGGSIIVKQDSDSPFNGWGVIRDGQQIRFQYLSTSTSDELTVRSTDNVFAAVDTWYHIAVVYNNETISMYVNGVPVATTINVNTLSSNVDNTVGLNVGNRDNNDASLSEEWEGEIDEVKIYNYARSAGQIVEDMNGSHPLGGSPVGSALGYWKLDEGANNTCPGGTNDACNSGSSGATHDGAGSGLIWTNNGKFNKAVDFDGSNTTISIGNASSFPAHNATQSMTGWFYYTSVPSEVDVIFTTGNNAASSAITIGTLGTGNFDVWRHGGTVLVNTTAPSANAWHHYAYTFDGTTHKLYLDGRLKSTSTVTPNSGTPNAANIGDWVVGGFKFTGMIDEVKLYTGELSAAEVLIDYNQGKSFVLGAFGTDSDGKTASNSAERSFCPPGDTTASCGPIGYWDFEEGTGTSAYDISGNGYTGTLTSSPIRDPGKFGQGLTFDGSTNYVSGTGPPLDGASTATISFWMKTSSGTADDYVVAFPNVSAGTNGFDVRTNTTSMNVFLKTSGGTADLSNSTTFADGKWHYFAATYDGTTLTSYWDGVYKNSTAISGTIDVQADNEFNFGRFGSGGFYFAGSVDEVRVYNYALSRGQIAWDYNKGKPVGLWKLDECSGTTINDVMGNVAAATLTIGASGSEDTVGDCSTASTAWGSGASGKRNYSLSFDGTDDYISIPHSTNLDVQEAFTLEAWVYPTSSVNGAGVITEEFTGGADRVQFELGFGLAPGGGTAPMVGFYTGGAWNTVADPTNITNNTWTHIAGTYDGTTLKIYTNGVLRNSAAASGQGVDTNSIWIGRRHDTGGTVDYFPGQIDDVRIYNHARTAAQIKADMNDGAVRWGPASGAP